jgi:methyltransferase-like protein/SAM-dependent methyltransferase
MNSESQTTTSYDEIPYSDTLFSDTHPERLATFAALFGMNPVAVDRCRVLELGCGTGSNLIPMAHGLPNAQFFGIDLSKRQIAMGQKVATGLGLQNLRLEAMSITDVAEDLGKFDYIICHGVYSWVPEEVRDHIMRICRENLAPMGIAYISYNTYPGWHIRSIFREALNFHVERFPDPATKIAQGRGLLKVLLECAGGPETVHGSMVQNEIEILTENPDTYFFHEHLEDINQPMYFHQFMAHAQAHGLQYVTEASPSPFSMKLSNKIMEAFKGVARNVVELEQYLDFARNGTFRTTLLCHENVSLHRPPEPEAVKKFKGVSRARLVDQAADLITPGAEVTFMNPNEIKVTVGHPLVKLALAILYEQYPLAVSFEDLWNEIRARASAQPAALKIVDDCGPNYLSGLLLNCFMGRLADLHIAPPEVASRSSERPVASPLARYMAGFGPRVPNLRHRTVILDEFDRTLLRLLDGTRDRAALCRDLVDQLSRQQTRVIKNGQEFQGPALEKFVAENLEHALKQCADTCLLVG